MDTPRTEGMNNEHGRALAGGKSMPGRTLVAASRAQLSSRTHRAFTLIELMVVVALIGVISSIAIPSYNILVCRGKQSEAKSILSAVVVSEEAYRAEHDTYVVGLVADITILGLIVTGTKSRYVYDVQGAAEGDGKIRAYKAIASGLRDMSGDVIEITHNKITTNTIDICQAR